MVEPGHRVGGGLRALPLHVRVHGPPNPGVAALGDGMRARLGFLGVNAALPVLAGPTLFPLPLLICASCPRPRQARTSPPPVPLASASLQVYRALFSRHGP